jgi:uncharacterized membrane protein
MTTKSVTTGDAPRSTGGFRISLKLISAILVVIALGITGYMTWAKIANVPLECTNEGFINCAVVENSAWAYIVGVPTATWGMLAHLMIGSVLLLEGRQEFFTRYGVFLIFGIALFAVMYHSYLIYISVAVLRALCPWCLAAATTMLLQLITTSLRLRNALASANA